MKTRHRISRRAALVHADAVVHCAAQPACERLERLLAGRPHLAVGVGTARKSVRASLRESRQIDRTSIGTLTWQPTGHLAACYPSLEGRVAVTEIDATTSLLTLDGRYQPPLGTFGEIADRAAMHVVAESTAGSVVRMLAAVLGERPASSTEEARDARSDVDSAPDI